MFHNDQFHTGRSPCIGPNNPAVIWSKDIGSSFEMSSPIIGDDYTIYIGVRSGILYAFNSDSTTKWTYSTGDRIMAAAAISIDSTIYVSSCDNSIHAVNFDGTGKWTHATASWLQSSPAIDSNGIIHIGGYDTDLYAIEDSVTYGKRRWNYNTGGNIFSDPAVWTDGTQYNGSCDDRLYAIDIDGNFQWSYLAGGNFYYSDPAIGSDGTIYIGNDDGNLHAVNPNGSPKWTYNTGGAINGCPAIALDGTIYIGSRDDSLYAIEDSVTYGKLKWAFGTNGDIRYSSPIIDKNGVIYIGGDDFNLYAIEDSITYGNLKWSIRLDAAIWSTPSIGPDSVLYIITTDGTFYAIGEAPTGIELTGFEATAEPNRNILRWRTEQEMHTILWYIIKRNLRDGNQFTEIGRVKAGESTPTPTEYRFIDKDVIEGNTYHYKLGLLKVDGSTVWFGPVSVVATGAKGFIKVSPNPFSSSIHVQLLGLNESSKKNLDIYDASGRLVYSIKLETSTYQLGNDLLPGIYFLKLEAGEHTETKKIIKVR
jgi:outer membrane protein assembly factor BamB